MSKIKAVVLEKSGSRYTVLSENGAFRHVRRRQNAEVGEEIEIQTGLEGLTGLRLWASLAAMFLLVITTLFGWNLYQAPTAVALVSVDINPSIQFNIDTRGHLINVNTQNTDAEQLLSKLELKGKPIDKVLGEIVTEAYKQRFLNPEQPWIVVGYSSLVDDTLQPLPRGLSEAQVVSWVTKVGEESGFAPQVEFFALTPQERELAQKGDLTLGEYALWQTAVKAGVETQPDKLKDTSERVRLLEDPKVQAQVKEDKKGLDNKKESNNSQNKGQGDKDEQSNKKDHLINSEKRTEKTEEETEKNRATEKRIKGVKEKGQEHKETQAQLNYRDKDMKNLNTKPSFLGAGKSSSTTPKDLPSQSDKSNKPKNIKN